MRITRLLIVLLCCLLLLSLFGCASDNSKVTLPDSELQPRNAEEAAWLSAPPPNTSSTGISLTKKIHLLSATGQEGDFNPGYWLCYQPKLVSERKFKGEVRECRDIIRQQYTDYLPIMSTSPSFFKRDFSSTAQAIEYLGYPDLEYPEINIPIQSASIIIDGNPDGRIMTATLEVWYEDDAFRMQGFSRMYTKYNENDVTVLGVHVDSSMAEAEYIYETAKGKHCLILRCPPTENGYYGIDGYLLQESVCYNFHVIYQENQYEQARDYLYSVLDLF